MGALTQSLKTVPIERGHGLTADIFYERYLSGVGKPVVVTDALHHWGARSKWTFEFLKSKYGSDTVLPRAGRGCLRLMKLADFIDYVETPQEPVKGFWIDPATRTPRAAPPVPPNGPLYLAWNIFALHPELLEDVELSPRFIDDWLPALPGPFRVVLDSLKNYFSAGILIGPPGAASRLHRDILHTHAYLAHLAGTKRCLLFPPDTSAELNDALIDLERPDFAAFPCLKDAAAFECTLQPGELLFIPSCWWHQVVSLEKTITVNYNFFNRANFAGYLTDVFRDLPAVVDGLEALPEAKRALGLRWTSKGFE